MKISQKLLILGGLLALAPQAFAAYNSVSLQSDAIISSAGVTINVSGNNSVLENMVVDTGSFTMQMQPSSYVMLTVPTYNKLSYSDSSADGSYVNYTCDLTHSILEITRSSGATTTITVTPSSTLCGADTVPPAGGGGGPIGGGGGGGGGGSYTYTPPVTPVAPPTSTGSQADALAAQLAALKAQLAGLNASAKLTKNLKRGMTDVQVLVLQKLLNADIDTRISASGAGSPGMETKLFGMLTEAAVKKFQKKYGIASSGTPATTGYGAVGPKTRAKLNSLIPN